LALKVEYRFKQLPKRDKEAIIKAGRFRIDRESGEISWSKRKVPVVPCTTRGA
jgi:hypothetical protein